MRTIKAAILILGVSMLPGKSHGNTPIKQGLEVRISPGKAPRTVNCKIKNATTRRMEFWSWICSYTDEWAEVDNKSVSVVEKPCDKNFLGINFLEPGKSREWTVAVTLAPKKYADTEVFRMAFAPSQPSPEEIVAYNHSSAVLDNPDRRSTSPLKGKFWSNAIKISGIRQ
jgi:hypothetical protein